MHTFANLVLLLPLLSSSALSQAEGSRTQTQNRSEPLLMDQLVLQHFNPIHADPAELLNVAEDFFGRQLLVSIAEGEKPSLVFNLRRYNNSLIVFDTKEQVTRILEGLRELEKISLGVANRESAIAANMVKLDPARLYEVSSFRARHVSLETLGRALTPFNRFLEFRDEWGHSNRQPNVSMIEERGILILREKAEKLAAMRALLESIDQPTPQVMLTCMLLRATETESESKLPKELSDNLAQLLPDQSFELLTTNFLRSSTAVGESITMELDSGHQHFNYSLLLRFSSFDQSSATLNADRCEFLEINGGNKRSIFMTNTSLNSNQYTVLGAAGRDPLFVVLRVTVLPN